MTAASPPRERLPGLDVLRGLAALAVVAFHFTTRFGMVFGHPTPPPLFAPWGQRGVEVFFVTSGFAIELSLESAAGARDFLVSRAVRLYPTFWAALAVTLAVVGVFGLPERALSIHDALLNLTMIPASLGAQAADAVYWTLERELRFYGLVLLLLSLGLRRFTTHALLLTVALQTLGTVSHGVPHWLSDVTNAGFAHLFACGVLLARARRGASWRSLALVSLCLLASRALGAAQLAYGAGAVGLVWGATRPFAGAYVRAPSLFGKISYPLYLVHQYLGYVVMRALYARGASPSAAILSATVASVCTAAALHFLVEEPSLALLRRKRSQVTPPVCLRESEMFDQEEPEHAGRRSHGAERC